MNANHYVSDIGKSGNKVFDRQGGCFELIKIRRIRIRTKKIRNRGVFEIVLLTFNTGTYYFAVNLFSASFCFCFLKNFLSFSRNCKVLVPTMRLKKVLSATVTVLYIPYVANIS